MNILADVAADGDRDKLRKMMEQGQVDVYKYLPLVLDEMGRRAQVGMEGYFKSVLYQQRRVQRANEDFLRTFMDSGASEGMLAIYRAFSQSVEDSIPMAERLGDMFRRAGHLISAGIVMPQEFLDWMNNKEREGNFMTALFGPSGESKLLSSITYVIDTLKNLFKEVSDSSSIHLGNVKDDFLDIVEIASFLIRRLADIMNIATGYATGGIEGGGYEIRKAIARSQIRGYVDDSADAEEVSTGKRVTERERNRRTRLAMDEWVENNPFVESGSFLSKPVNPLYFLDPRSTFKLFSGEDSDGSWLGNFNPFTSNKTVRDMLGIGGEDSDPTTDERSRNWLANRFNSQGVIQYGPFEDFNRNFQGPPERIPFNTPMTDKITPEVRITVSGKITVDGELGTVIDDTNISERFNEQLEQIMFGARSQFSVVHR